MTYSKISECFKIRPATLCLGLSTLAGIPWSAGLMNRTVAKSLISETTAGLSEIKDFATVRFINPALHGIPASVDKPKHKVAGLILKHSEIFEYVMLLQAEGSVYMLEPYDLQIKLSHHNLAFTDWYKKLMSTGQTRSEERRVGKECRSRW